MISALTLRVLGKLLIKYWPILATIALALAVFFYWNHRTTLIEQQQQQITNLITEKAKLEERCNQEKQQLLTAIEQQNQAIEKLQRLNQRNKNLIKQSKDDIAKTQKFYNEQINKILSEKKPEDCKQAIEYLINAGRDISHLKVNNNGSK